VKSHVDQILADLARLGIEITAVDGRIRCRPAASVPAELRRRASEFKPELLARIESRGRSQRSQTGSEETGRTTRSDSRPAIAPYPSVNACCFACGGGDFWALAQVGYWVCGHCHAPDASPEPLIWIRVGDPGSPTPSARPNAVCLKCYGTRFVRLRDGRRSVCAACERPQPDQIVGEDDGVVGGAA
jgi:hypothetical protein